MEYLELVKELVPYVLSIWATVISFRADKRVKPKLTEEAIIEKAEKKKEQYLKKHLKNFQSENKNEEVSEKVVVNSYENVDEGVY